VSVPESSNQSAIPQAEAELVAYLDGELDSVQNAEVERRLCEDAEYRRRLRQLQKSWDLMDLLPQVDVDQSFTQSTLAMVAVRATDQANVEQTRQRKLRKRIGWAVSLSTIAAFLAGYMFVNRAVQRQNRQLLQDLPVIERMDEYRYADSVEFLRLLEQEGLFAEEDVEDDI
jgi:anti-sigma factor RsiW